MKSGKRAFAEEERPELSYLHDFSCDCADPRIAEALKMLVANWLAESPHLPHFLRGAEKELNLTEEQGLQIKWLLALNPNTPPTVLEDLCNGATAALLERVAENPHASPETLAKLAYQAVAEIRIAVGGNIHTPLATILILAKDDNPDVRFSLGENPYVPVEALEALTRDDNPYVRFRAERTLGRLGIGHKN
ncbi:MAG TPA: hypothetical protein V6D08_12000 [Candidatus Obscuribacterales bacterium]